MDIVPENTPAKQPRTDFYAYMYRRDDIPFYIGKGCGDRINVHERCAKRRENCKHHACRVIRKVWREDGKITKEKICENVSEQSAHSIEKLMIAYGHACNWPLVNLTNGGEGMSGYRHPPEVQARIAANRANNLTQEDRIRYGKRSKQMWANPEFREKQIMLLRSPKLQDARLRGARKTKHAKTYKGFIAPDGAIYAPVHNMTVFCKEHGLTPTCMFDLAQGKYLQHKGWTTYPPLERERKKSGPAQSNCFAFIDPNGIVYDSISNLAAFCREHDLRPDGMSKVWRGEGTSHKGWTKYPPVPPQNRPSTYFGPGFVSPDGTIYANIHSLSAFCREHNLDLGTMRKIAYNRGRAKSYKGWIKYEPEQDQQ